MKKIKSLIDKELEDNVELFFKKTKSEMHYFSKEDDSLSKFDWINEIYTICPYIDNIVRQPRINLVSEEDVVKIDEAKGITPLSVKDLSLHTEYIDDTDPQTDEVKLSKILIERSEETYNVYENRLIYTLIDNLDKFISKNEKLFNDIETDSKKTIEYIANTENKNEKISIELKITTKEIIDNGKEQMEIALLREKLEMIRKYMLGWHKSGFYSSLVKNRASFVTGTVRKTNVILKNPNFQFAMQLWDYLKFFDEDNNLGESKIKDSSGSETIMNILNDTFLKNYSVLDSISNYKRKEKKQLSKYAIILLERQLKSTIDLLTNNGYDISEEELLGLIEVEIKKEKDKNDIGVNDIKNRFNSSIKDYMSENKEFL